MFTWKKLRLEIMCYVKTTLWSTFYEIYVYVIEICITKFCHTYLQKYLLYVDKIRFIREKYFNFGNRVNT